MFIAVCAMGLVLLAAGCCETPTPVVPVHLTIAASTSTEPLARTLADVYTERNAGADVRVIVGNSRWARNALAGGEADLALLAGEPEPAGDEWESTQVAMDGVAVIVSAANPVRSLSTAQVRDLFSGRIQSWAQAGGEDAEVHVVSRESGSGTRAFFDQRAMLGRAVTSMAVLMPNTKAVIEEVAGDPLSIGYVTSAALTSNVRAVALEGVAPTAETIRSGRYALARVVALEYRSGIQGAVLSFVDMCAGAAGQEAVAKVGFIPLN